MKLSISWGSVAAKTVTFLLFRLDEHCHPPNFFFQKLFQTMPDYCLETTIEFLLLKKLRIHSTRQDHKSKKNAETSGLSRKD